MPDPLHPHYGEAGVVFDGGFFYSDGLPDVPPTPTPNNRTRMASLSLNLSNLKRNEIINLAAVATSAMAPAAPTPAPIPGVSAEVTATETAASEAADAVAAWESGKATQNTLKTVMDTKMDTLRSKLRALASAVEAKAEGNPAILVLSGLPVSGAAVPSEPPGIIMNLSVTASDNPGSLDVHWDPERFSQVYEIEVSTTHPVDGPWTRLKTETKSSTTASGLTSGTRAWVHVRGVGTKGNGPWSDPATKIVP